MAGKEKSAKSWHTNLIPIPQLLRDQQKNRNFFSFTHLFLPSPIEFCQQKLAHFSTSFCWHWYWQQLNWATITNLSQQTQLFSWLKNFDVEGRKAKVFKSFGVFGRFGRTIMLVYFDFRVGIVVSSCGVLSDFLTHCHRQKKSLTNHTSRQLLGTLDSVGPLFWLLKVGSRRKVNKDFMRRRRLEAVKSSCYFVNSHVIVRQYKLHLLCILQWNPWRSLVWLEVELTSLATWHRHFPQTNRIWYSFIKMSMEHRFTGKTWLL